MRSGGRVVPVCATGRAAYPRPSANPSFFGARDDPILSGDRPLRSRPDNRVGSRWPLSSVHRQATTSQLAVATVHSMAPLQGVCVVTGDKIVRYGPAQIRVLNHPLCDSGSNYCLTAPYFFNVFACHLISREELGSECTL